MLELARSADSLGAGCVWVADHFSGAVVDRRWSRDPFVSLGAIAAVTQRVDVGVLVANVVNRHPVQLAVATNSLQSIAPGRVRLGVGSGASPGSKFAIEHDAIGTVLDDAETRRTRLVATIAALRSIWAGADDFVADPTVVEVGFSGLSSVVDGVPIPPIIVGASAWPTIEVALEHADGVNLRRTATVSELIRRVRHERPTGFDVSVLDWFDDVAQETDRIARYAELGVDRLVLGISPPHDAHRLTSIEFVTDDGM